MLGFSAVLTRLVNNLSHYSVGCQLKWVRAMLMVQTGKILLLILTPCHNYWSSFYINYQQSLDYTLGAIMLKIESFKFL